MSISSKYNNLAPIIEEDETKSEVLDSNNMEKKTELRILICGSRNWTDKWRIGRYLDELLEAVGLEPEQLVVIHGGYKGADHHAGIEAKCRGCQVLEFPGNWSKFGLSAGPKRNQQMLTEGKPDRVVAFHPDWEKSKGTKDMVARAKFYGIPVEIITC
jgi:hypothetical protein